MIDQATLDPDRHAFQITVVKLMVVSLACALFTGMRGGLFTLAMARLNIRFRERLFRSLLSQDIAYFDTTKTGGLHELSQEATSSSDAWFHGATRSSNDRLSCHAIPSYTLPSFL